MTDDYPSYCAKHGRHHFGCPCPECDPDYYAGLKRPDDKPDTPQASAGAVEAETECPHERVWRWENPDGCWWQCDDCKRRFIPAHLGSDAEVLDLRTRLAAAEQELKLQEQHADAFERERDEALAKSNEAASLIAEMTEAMSDGEREVFRCLRAAESREDEALARERALREALDRYGEHFPGCRSEAFGGVPPNCDCGLRAALKEPAKSIHTPPCDPSQDGQCGCGAVGRHLLAKEPADASD